jgi:hypothetical protein
MSAQWNIIPTIGENKTCSKQPTRFPVMGGLWHGITHIVKKQILEETYLNAA